MSKISDERLRELIAQHEKLGLTEWVSLGRELLALRARHREARQWMKHTSECASIKRRFDRVPFGEKARATYYESLRCTCGLDAFLAAEQPAQEKVAP